VLQVSKRFDLNEKPTPAESLVPKNGLFILVDALRADALIDPVARRYLTPTLARLADNGFVCSVVANAQGTQFVMPALHSLTYPLDHGGYNNGIRDRPKCIAETMRESGLETYMLANAGQLGVTMGYDRGFNTIHAATDYRGLISERIKHTLKYHLDLWKEGVRTESETIEIITLEFGMLLERMGEMIEHQDKLMWPRAIRRINARVAMGIAAEQRLLQEEPSAILRKLTWLPGSIYWRFLGVRQVRPMSRFFWAVIAALKTHTRNYIAKRPRIPFFLLSHYPAIFSDVIRGMETKIAELKDKRWFAYVHLMDVHDCRALNRPFHVAGRLRYLPRWLLARARGLTNRRWVYDTAVMYVDRKLGRIIRALEATGQLRDTVILVTGDHGDSYPESPREKGNVASRTHYENIDVPMLLSGAGKAVADIGMIDSMGMSASLLDALGIKPHPSFKGRSVFEGGRAAVISESCGSGNADISRRDIFFTVTTETHRMMATLVGTELQPTQIYNRRVDPRELDNLIDDPEQREIVETLIGHIFSERREIMDLRGVIQVSSATQSIA
jgi:hypothetical protein